MLPNEWKTTEIQKKPKSAIKICHKRNKISEINCDLAKFPSTARRRRDLGRRLLSLPILRFCLGSLALQLFSMYLDRPTSKDTSGLYL